MKDKSSPKPRKTQQRSLQTRDRIIRAAQKLFVKQGFSAVKVEAVARLAKINHSLIYHHFKSKQALWLAVKQHIVKHSDFSLTKEDSDNMPCVDFIRHVVRKSISFYQDNPHIVSLINWQRMEKNHENIGAGRTSEAKKWIAAFSKYQQNGEITLKAKPEYIMTMVLGITSSAVMDKNVFIKKKQDFEDYIEYCVAALQRALC